MRTIVILILLTSVSAMAQIPYRIVGTGVNVCYNNIAVISCPLDSAAAFFGQDQGLSPSYQDNGDGTVTDLNTGLMWMQARGNKMSWDSTFLMASQFSLGGHTDWRVPTIKELYSLINYNGKSAPQASGCIAYIDTTYFRITYGNVAIGERVIDGQDWSATKYKGLTMVGDSTVFGVNFIDGRIKGYPQYKPGTGNTVKYRLFVRFVRDNTSYGINQFTDNGDSTITDHATRLMWMKNDSKAGMNWQSALAYAQAKNLAHYKGYSDWRLPTAKELQSIVDYTRCKDFTNSAAIDPIFNITQITDEGGSVNWPFFWANTTHLDNMGGVYVCFGEALGWMHVPPTATWYTLQDVHGAGAQRSDPKAGSPSNYLLGYTQGGQPCYGLGPQGDVVRINNYVRLVRDDNSSADIEEKVGGRMKIIPNPASSSFSVYINGLRTADGLVTVTDLYGRIALESGMSAIDVSMLPPGMYFVHYQSKGFAYFSKLLVNH